jgi:hypothetical protein
MKKHLSQIYTEMYWDSPDDGMFPREILEKSAVSDKFALNDYSRLIYENIIDNNKELLPNTKFQETLNIDTLKVYRSSAKPNKQAYESGSHAGTKQQALIRADYMVNDEEKYQKYFLYELIIDLGRIYPKLLPDDGSDHGYDYTLDLIDKYDTAFYKNTGEGDIRNENLSIIIINPRSIKSDKMVGELTKEYLLSIQEELYS